MTPQFDQQSLVAGIPFGLVSKSIGKVTRICIVCALDDYIYPHYLPSD